MKTHLNLVPEAYRRRLIIRRLVARWLIVWSVACLAAGSYWLYARNLTEAHRQDVASLESMVRPIREMQDSSRRLRVELSQLEQNDALLRRLQDEGSPITPVAMVSQSAQESAGRVWIRKLALESRQKAQSLDKKNEKKEEAAEPSLHVKIEGVAADHLAVAEFIAALRKSNALRQIELKSSIPSRADGSATRVFTVEGEL